MIRLPLFFVYCFTQDVGAPFQDELSAADAADKESLAQHLQLVDEVLFPSAGGLRVARTFICLFFMVCALSVISGVVHFIRYRQQHLHYYDFGEHTVLLVHPR